MVEACQLEPTTIKFDISTTKNKNKIEKIKIKIKIEKNYLLHYIDLNSKKCHFQLIRCLGVKIIYQAYVLPIRVLGVSNFELKGEHLSLVLGAMSRYEKKY